MPTATTAETLELTSTHITIHPLVLLSVADSYNRSAQGTKKRVLGVCLGQNNGKSVNIANSFAIPFEEDEKDPSVWFLDHNFVESMYDMFKKINGIHHIYSCEPIKLTLSTSERKDGRMVSFRPQTTSK